MPIHAYILIAALAAVLILLAVLCFRAARVTKFRNTRSAPRKTVDAATNAIYVDKLSDMLRCETIADGEHAEQFEAFRAIIARDFPLLHRRAAPQIFGDGCLIWRIEGENPRQRIMLMSHHDVVAADASEWSHPPFDAQTADGMLYGRGAVDTKTPLFAELQAVEELLREGHTFDGLDLYIGSSGNEEICGDGIPEAVKYFKAQGIRFDAVFDEGGAVTSGMMPGVSEKSAMIAIHEKGRHTVRCVAKDDTKGHAGLTLKSSDTVGRMAAFIAEVNKSKLFKARFYPEVHQTFAAHAPYMSFPYRVLFANFGFFKGLLLKVLPRVSDQVGGMLSTTMKFTAIEGGVRPQVAAKETTATAFFRCVRETDLERELEAFRRIAKKHGIETDVTLRDYCRPSAPRGDAYARLVTTLHENYPDVIVSPFLLTAGTDARHFTDIADSILRFAPIDLSRAQFASVHNANENIAISNIGECVCFYRDLVQKFYANTIGDKD